MNDIGISQSALAEYMGCSRGRLGKILEGDDFLVSELINMCDKLKLVPTEVFAAATEYPPAGIDPKNVMSIVAYILALPDEARDGLERMLKGLWDGYHCVDNAADRKTDVCPDCVPLGEPYRVAPS